MSIRELHLKNSLKNVHYSVKDINGFISVKGEVLSQYTITLYIPSSEFDTIPNETNTVSTAGVFIHNGIHTKTGAFNKQEIRIEQKENEATFVVSNFDAVFNIPAEIDVDDVAVEIESHGGVDEQKMFNEELSNTNTYLENNDIQFQLIPNPTTKSNIGFSYTNTQQNDVIKMQLFDKNGNLLFTSTDFSIDQNVKFENILNLNYLNLRSGLYYITIQNNTGKLLFKQLQINE